MSQVCLNLVKVESFIDTDFGIMMNDDYSKSYDLSMTPTHFTDLASNIVVNNLNVLDFARQSDDEEIQNILNSVRENTCGIKINGKYYDWAEIADRM
jgi:hypothetical protein